LQSTCTGSGGLNGRAAATGVSTATAFTAPAKYQANKNKGSKTMRDLQKIISKKKKKKKHL
jgi:phosphotransferase system HPr-like phosphotransfer protein